MTVKIKNIDQPPLTLWERIYLGPVLKGLFVTLRHIFRRKITMQYPEDRREQKSVQKGGLLVKNYRGLHRLNRDSQGRVACVACFMCETACPADCIHIVAGAAPWPDREKYPEIFEIDELRCIYCGMCEYACPVDAIELTPVYDFIGYSREEMLFTKERLIEMYDRTKDIKPRENPLIVGYNCTIKQEAVQYHQDFEAAENAKPENNPKALPPARPAIYPPEEFLG